MSKRSDEKVQDYSYHKLSSTANSNVHWPILLLPHYSIAIMLCHCHPHLIIQYQDCKLNATSMPLPMPDLPLRRDRHMKLGAVPSLASFKQHLKPIFNTAVNSDSVMHPFSLHFCNHCTTNVSRLTCYSHTKSHTKPTACKWPMYFSAICAVQFVNLQICTFSNWKIHNMQHKLQQELIMQMRYPNVIWRIILPVYLFTTELRHTCSSLIFF